MNTIQKNHKMPQILIEFRLRMSGRKSIMSNRIGNPEKKGHVIHLEAGGCLQNRPNINNAYITSEVNEVTCVRCQRKLNFGGISRETMDWIDEKCMTNSKNVLDNCMDDESYEYYLYKLT